MTAFAAFCAEARAAWPEIDVAEDVFEAFVHERAGDRPLDALRAADLYLACACTHGDPRAIELLDARYIATLAPAVRKVAGDAQIADVLQTVRLRFLVDEPRRIADYDGSGALGTWLRVAAVRIAIDGHRKTQREAPEDAGGEPIDDVPGPELEALQHRYGPEVRAAFQAGFARLAARERNLIRQHVLDRLGIDPLAALYGVHRATAARWVAHAREHLIANVRAELRTRLAVSDDELDSLFRLVESKLEISVRMFATPTPG